MRRTLAISEQMIRIELTTFQLGRLSFYPNWPVNRPFLTFRAAFWLALRSLGDRPKQGRRFSIPLQAVRALSGFRPHVHPDVSTSDSAHPLTCVVLHLSPSPLIFSTSPLSCLSNSENRTRAFVPSGENCSVINWAGTFNSLTCPATSKVIVIPLSLS